MTAWPIRYCPVCDMPHKTAKSMRCCQHNYFHGDSIISCDGKWVKCDQHGIRPLVIADEWCNGQDCDRCVEEWGGPVRKEPA